MIKKAYMANVIAGPFLYTNTGMDVILMDDIEKPIEYLKECKKDNETTLAYALDGYWNFLQFKHGTSTLQYTEAIIPNSLNKYQIENIEITKKGKLPQDPYPHGWTEKHWKIYNFLYSPQEISFRQAGIELGWTWRTVKKYYNEVLTQCKILTSFFPIGRTNYHHQLLTFKTDYEIGVLHALKKLDRTSYVYKARDIMILILFCNPDSLGTNKSARKFKELEEKGILRDLHVCTPLYWTHFRTFSQV
ncbi:MAG: hypothetical protein PVF58_03185 [Candidatus Methanofastidiosia archaeon]|jgi:hypothetical protein